MKQFSMNKGKSLTLLALTLLLTNNQDMSCGLQSVSAINLSEQHMIHN
jgi:hypothetical protein